MATGFRPDLSALREIRLSLDPWLECAAGIGPLIDPNLHSCGTVRPHGARELAHAEEGFFIAGMKSYGRALTFLLATGHEQVRSIAAALTGDMEAAARVELMLPETGVCNARPSTRAPDDGSLPPRRCCGGPAPAEARRLLCARTPRRRRPAQSGCGCPPEPNSRQSRAAAAPKQRRPSACDASRSTTTRPAAPRATSSA